MHRALHAWMCDTMQNLSCNRVNQVCHHSRVLWRCSTWQASWFGIHSCHKHHILVEILEENFSVPKYFGLCVHYLHNWKKIVRKAWIKIKINKSLTQTRTFLDVQNASGFAQCATKIVWLLFLMNFFWVVVTLSGLLEAKVAINSVSSGKTTDHNFSVSNR